jgi:hypothetical protein
MKNVGWLGVLVAVVATSSQGATVTPGKQLELPMDAGTLPDDCRQFLAMIPDSRSDLLPWYQKLSVAACRQRVETTPVTTPQQLGPLVKGLEGQMGPSIAIYSDAATRGPQQIPILSQYWLGMTYLNVAVRARRAVDAGASVGGATYGGWSDGAMGLHRALEPLIARDLQNALVAFREVDRLATANPQAACADQVVSTAVEHARAMLAMLPKTTEIGGTKST